MTLLKPPIIQIRLDDLDKVDNQLNYSEKYVVLWDKTANGTVNAKYRSKGIVVELEKEQDRVARKLKTEEDIGETLRAKMVSAMRIGKLLIICVGEEMPDFDKYKVPDSFGITWDDVFNWGEFRKKENYMKLLKDNENYDKFVNKGMFEMDKEFNVAFMSRYVKE